jgi:hypothetical protein
VFTLLYFLLLFTLVPTAHLKIPAKITSPGKSSLTLHGLQSLFCVMCANSYF